jgi:hypothetical protein
MSDDCPVLDRYQQMDLDGPCDQTSGHHCPRGVSTGPRIQEYSNWAEGHPRGYDPSGTKKRGRSYARLEVKTGLWYSVIDGPRPPHPCRSNSNGNKCHAYPVCQGLCPPSVPPPAAPPLPPLAPCQDVVVTLWNPRRVWTGLNVKMDGVAANFSSVATCAPSPTDCCKSGTCGDDCCSFDFAVCRQPGCFPLQIVGTPMPPHLYWYAPGPPTLRHNIHSHLILNPPPGP